jgi:hypothetical protein
MVGAQIRSLPWSMIMSCLRQCVGPWWWWELGYRKHRALLFLTGLADVALTRAAWMLQRVLLWLPYILPVFFLDTTYFST